MGESGREGRRTEEIKRTECGRGRKGSRITTKEGRQIMTHTPSTERRGGLKTGGRSTGRGRGRDRRRGRW